MRRFLALMANGYRYLSSDQDHTDVFELCRKEGIVLVPYSSSCGKEIAAIAPELDIKIPGDFCAFEAKGHRVIIFDDRCRQERQQFTIAVGLGCFVLGHTKEDLGVKQQQYKHLEAENFAFRLLCPLRDFIGSL